MAEEDFFAKELEGEPGRYSSLSPASVALVQAMGTDSQGTRSSPYHHLKLVRGAGWMGCGKGDREAESEKGG